MRAILYPKNAPCTIAKGSDDHLLQFCRRCKSSRAFNGEKRALPCTMGMAAVARFEDLASWA